MKYNNVIKYENIWEVFAAAARDYPDRPLLNYQRGLANLTLTYQEFFQAVKKLAAFLVNQGLHPQDKLIIYTNSSAQWLQI
jgi:long-subunit acyl-CoA synthetase (AMP-forming)